MLKEKEMFNPVLMEKMYQMKNYFRFSEGIKRQIELTYNECIRTYE